MKKIFIILAYCNTEQKVKELKETILSIKRYNYDILLYSHYIVDGDIQQMCKYVVYDYSNPILSDKHIYAWYESYIIPFKIEDKNIDYGYTVLQQIKRSIQYVYNLGYEHAFFLNYDISFPHDIFDEYRNKIDIVDGVFFNKDKNLPKLLFFFVNISKFVDIFKVISPSHYIDSNEIAERYFYNLINSDKLLNNQFNDIIIEGRNTIYENDNSIYNGHTIKIGRYDDCLAFLCFDIENNFDFEFLYDDKLIFKSKIYKYQSYYFNIILDDFDNIKFNKISLNIDGEKITSNELSRNIENCVIYKKIKKNENL